MKKLVSIISAIAICASFAVSASALEVDSESSLITGVPTKAEVAARTPEITITAEKATSKQDVVDAGVATLAAAQYYKEGTYDTYIMTLTATNVGDLGCGYKEGTYDDADKAGLVIPAIAVSFTNDAKIQKYVIGNMSFTKAKSIGVQGTLNAVFGSATDMGYSYPAFDAETLMGGKIANPTLTAKFVLCLNAGDTMELVTEEATISYVLGDGTVGSLVPVTVDVAPVTLGEAAPEITYDDVKTGAFTFTVGPKYNGNEGFKVYFNKTEDGAKSTVYGELAKEKIFGDSEVQADMDVTVGVQVTDVPSNVVLEFLRAEWLETLTK